MKTFARADCREEIVRRVQRVRPDSVRRWGTMTPHEMICHLSDACRVALDQKRVSTATSAMTRTLMKWTALYLPVRWPRGIQTRPEIDQRGQGTPPADFAADVAQLQALLERIASHASDREWPDHPIFGKMSHAAWMRWAYLHADHHLRQFGV